MVEVKDITGMIEGALTQIINAKVEEEKARMFVFNTATEALETIFVDYFNVFEEFLKSKDYVRAEGKTELTDEEKEEIALDWISDNPNEALSEALEKGADKEDVVEDWFRSADLFEILDKANYNYDNREIGKECFDRM